MGYDGSLKFDTEILEKGFVSGVKKLGGIAKSGLAILGSAVAGVTTAMGAGVAAGIKYNAAIEQYKTSFEVMTGSAEKAADVIERLKKVGAETPFELNDLADVTQLLMNYGFTADDAMDKMMILGDISQGSAEKMNRIAMAYGQMSSAGKVSLEDVKQMIEAGFNPLQEISESTGESMESLYKRISKGTISVDEITASMQRATSEGGKYFQSMEKQSQTINGMISTLKDNAMQLIGDVVKPITESFAKELLPGAIQTIEQLTIAFKEHGVEGLIEAGGQIVANLLLGIANALPGMIDIALQIIQSFISNLTLNMPQILSAGDQIIRTLIQGITQLLPMLGELAFTVITTFLQGIIANAPQMLTGGTKLLIDMMSGISSRISELVPLAVKAVLTFLQGIISNLPQIVSAGLDMLVSLAEGIADAMPHVIEQVPKIINSFCSNIDSLLPKILAAGVKILVSLGKGILQSIPTIIANAGEVVKAILNVITHLNLFNAGAGIIKGLGNGLKSMFGSISGVIKSLITKIKNPFKFDWGSIGKNIVSGIANGIKRGASAIANAAKNAAKSALNAAKRFLGIHSPSTVFRDQVGKYMAQGMGVGFEKNIPTEEMTDRMKKSVQSMSNSIQSVTDTPINTLPYAQGSLQMNDFVIDYERIGEETAKALRGVTVELDGKYVGDIMTPYISHNEYLNTRRRR